MINRILFTRHGETEDNLINRLSTSPPGPSLTELGRDQAKNLKKDLEDIEVSVIYTSPLVRAIQTAEILRGEKQIDIFEENELRELSVGAYEGRNDPDVFKELDKVWRKWTVEGELDTTMGIGGESAKQILVRSQLVINRILKKNISGTALVVAHSGILQLLVSYLCTNLPNSFGVKNWIRNCQLIDTKVQGQSLECISWGDIKVFDQPN